MKLKIMFSNSWKYIYLHCTLKWLWTLDPGTQGLRPGILRAVLYLAIVTEMQLQACCVDVLISNSCLCHWKYTIHVSIHTFKHFPKIDVDAGLLPECSVGICSRDGSSCTHATLLLVCHSSYGATINGKLLADCTANNTCRVEIALGKGRA